MSVGGSCSDNAAKSSSGALPRHSPITGRPGEKVGYMEEDAGEEEKEEEQVALQVCGRQADAALPGLVQVRVIEAARRLGLRVVLEPPRAADRSSWREAFITNW
ncbi:hypothetical protein VOLCADRAFT_94768 [Volvox carteri f. nagariensis]|uniref:Uncharacterized protein n=1 Tax=Volvox carteri f. nagariensis TaxID=3068 RepID=D8U5P7_VOLCA|nr:uncharacterized protein VOLCADRAFT_94768 [Volvox carteri f. nagariensis]EFJ45036.1 hypothetical protein VOLCADRAFT_94768 [Volvox carteri f. nagariensis]|eukprot:XP_002954007.1 hypothetical protein VOLCADRAFT_94768 [Volvox carteri f. nagariensis]